MRFDYNYTTSKTVYASNPAGMYSLFCQATSLNVCTDNHIPVCTFMAIVNSSKKKKGDK